MKSQVVSRRWSLSFYTFAVCIRSWYLWAVVCAMLLSALILGTALTLAPGLVAGKDNDGKPGMTVDLGYAKYQGTTTPGINQWLGIRYAAAPVGDLRFRGPKPPTDEMKKGVQKATKVNIVPHLFYLISLTSLSTCLGVYQLRPRIYKKAHPRIVFTQMYMLLPTCLNPIQCMFLFKVEGMDPMLARIWMDRN